MQPRARRSSGLGVASTAVIFAHAAFCGPLPRVATRVHRDNPKYVSVHTRHGRHTRRSRPSPFTVTTRFSAASRRQHLAAGTADLDPDDVVQDVVMRVLRRWTALRFDDERALAGYLHRAVVNRARDARRVAPRRAVVDLDLMRSPRTTALDGLVADEWRRRAAQALRQLRAGDRRVVVGRVVESLSFGDLAARTGHPAPTPPARRRRGRWGACGASWHKQLRATSYERRRRATG